jgi:hypothetical protein
VSYDDVNTREVEEELYLDSLTLTELDEHERRQAEEREAVS